MAALVAAVGEFVEAAVCDALLIAGNRVTNGAASYACTAAAVAGSAAGTAVSAVGAAGVYDTWK